MIAQASNVHTGGGGSDVFPRLPRAEKIISFDFALLS